MSNADVKDETVPETEVKVNDVTGKMKEHSYGAFAVERGSDGNIYLNFQDSDHHCISSCVEDFVSHTYGHRAASAMRRIYPATLITPILENVNNWLNRHRISEKDPARVVFTKVIDFAQKEQEALLKSKLESGKAEFADVPLLFKNGDEVITYMNEHLIGGIVESVRMELTWTGTRYYNIKIRVIHNLSGKISEGLFSTSIGEWHGLVNIADLPVRKITSQEKEKLVERGNAFARYAMGSNYVQYQGELVQPSWWSETVYRADGRFMADSAMMQRMDGSAVSQQARSINLTMLDGSDIDGDDDTDGINSCNLNESQLWRTSPYLYGFSFTVKRWGRVEVEGISDIAWRDNSFEQLVMQDDLKEMIRAIVSHNGNAFQDIIDGKGGGYIFLLYGPPGQGKTLTAETVAEALHRPLYSVSVGELGVNPTELEENLRHILDVATQWNAVLLLDEADIFLEARNETDIVRNAMVGVVLRLIEYYQGVLFLTTNRVKNIDSAFYSRISLAIQFEEADKEKRRKVWTNLLNASNLNAAWADKLSEYDVNGRQIKTAIRLSQTLAQSKGQEVDIGIIEKVLDMTLDFQSSMLQKNGPTSAVA